MTKIDNGLLLLARILLSVLFIVAGAGKLADPAGTAGMIEGAGFPAASFLAYVAGLYEVLAGLFILVGFQTKLTAYSVALFCVFTGLVFHSGTIAVNGWAPEALGLINMMNQIMLMKNITLAGGYLVLAIAGAGAYSVDARRGAATAVAA